MNPLEAQCCDISNYIWQQRYQQCIDPIVDISIEDTWRRVATALADTEQEQQQKYWQQQFYHALEGFKFIPGGRILAGAGINDGLTLFNCFVMGPLPNDDDRLIQALGESVKTLRYGGGIGCDFSTLIPRLSNTSKQVAPGSVAVMRVWNEACKSLQSYHQRRGAMMAALRCDHPDIEEFITAKADPDELRFFNCSVLVTNAFMDAVEKDRDWHLVFPLHRLNEYQRRKGIEDHKTIKEEVEKSNGSRLFRHWPGDTDPVECQILKTLPARRLWQQIMNATYRYSEPGVLFIDRINDLNNLYYCETISTTNPCGEIPLPAYGACDLGSINLTQFVVNAFTGQARIDMPAIRRIVPLAVRLLDNVIEASRYPLAQQEHNEKSSRRIGLGIMGLSDALIMLNLHYNSEKAQHQAAIIMRSIRNTAYCASVQLAIEKGSFPLFERDAYLNGRNVMRLPRRIGHAIHENGIRNSHLTAIAPTGTISLLAGNVSSGIEPLYSLQYRQKILNQRGEAEEVALVDYAYERWLEKKKQMQSKDLPDTFVTAMQIPPEQQLDMVAALQPYVDSAISKTISVADSIDFKSFASVYQRAYRLGLKGCTTFRSNPVTGSVVST